MRGKREAYPPKADYREAETPKADRGSKTVNRDRGPWSWTENGKRTTENGQRGKAPLFGKPRTNLARGFQFFYFFKIKDATRINTRLLWTSFHLGQRFAQIQWIYNFP